MFLARRSHRHRRRRWARCCPVRGRSPGSCGGSGDCQADAGLPSLAQCRIAPRAPGVVVALGATAGKALLGPPFRVTKDRGALLPLPPKEPRTTDDRTAQAQGLVVATLHPSALLRSRERETAYAGLVSDLRVAAGALD
ncbi:uracil-DNA glycosylase family protein [Streptomyces platensis]|uniref:uracil-DNA glycosylase family protein n=1 Tax=Streptomyces platensis TaxID=58346 RepID=UPI00378878D6